MKTLHLTASGRTGKQWVKHLEKNKYRINSYAKDLILSDEFAAARAEKGTEYEIAVVPGKDMYENSATTASIKEKAATKGWTLPTPEIALLMREALSDEEIEALGVWYVATLHDPTKDAVGDPSVLCSDRLVGGRGVDACWDRPGGRWDTRGAFAFVVPASTSSSETQDSPLETGSLDAAIAMVKAAGYTVVKIV